MRQFFLRLSVLLVLSSSVQAAEPDERTIQSIVHGSGLSEQDVRLYYNACNSGITYSMSVCAMYQYTIEDLHLNDLYAEVLKNVSRTSAEKKLIAAQRAWIAFRDASCDYESDGWSGGSGQGIVRLSCMAGVTRDRVRQLQEYAHCKQSTCPGQW